MSVPHDSIIGDQGEGDTQESSDGIVKYWIFLSGGIVVRIS
jgi:hypothetical protein